MNDDENIIPFGACLNFKMVQDNTLGFLPTKKQFSISLISSRQYTWLLGNGEKIQDNAIIIII